MLTPAQQAAYEGTQLTRTGRASKDDLRMFSSGIAYGIAQERSRCAKVCRDLSATSAHPGECLFCADAIESPTEWAT